MGQIASGVDPTSIDPCAKGCLKHSALCGKGPPQLRSYYAQDARSARQPLPMSAATKKLARAGAIRQLYRSIAILGPNSFAPQPECPLTGRRHTAYSIQPLCNGGVGPTTLLVGATYPSIAVAAPPSPLPTQAVRPFLRPKAPTDRRSPQPERDRNGEGRKRAEKGQKMAEGTDRDRKFLRIIRMLGWLGNLDSNQD